MRKLHMLGKTYDAGARLATAGGSKIRFTRRFPASGIFRPRVDSRFACRCRRNGAILKDSLTRNGDAKG